MGPDMKSAPVRGGSKLQRFVALLVSMSVFSLMLIAAQAVAPQSSPVLAPAVAHADGFGNDALIKNDKNSTQRIRACKNRVSDTKCSKHKDKKGKVINRRKWLKPGRATPKGQDWDGFWCPASSICSVRWPKGVWYEWHASPTFSSKFVPVGGCAGCTKVVRVYPKGGNGGGGDGGWRGGRPYPICRRHTL